MRKAKAHQAKQYNKKAFSKTCFEVGDLVLLANHRSKPNESKKLAPNYIGPYRVTEKLSDLNVRIRGVDSDYNKVVHVNNLRKYK